MSISWTIKNLYYANARRSYEDCSWFYRAKHWWCSFVSSVLNYTEFGTQSWQLVLTLSMQCEQLLAVQVLTKLLRVFSDISIILSQCVSSLWSSEEGWHRYMMVCVAWRIKSIITLASGIIHERTVNNSRKWHHQRSAFCSFYTHTPME